MDDPVASSDAPSGKPWCLLIRPDWHAGFLWPGDDATIEAFGIPVEPEDLPLSAATVAELARLEDWHDASLNWDYPPDPGPYREEECLRLNAAVHELVGVIRRELGPEWEVVDLYIDIHEDPDLDRYLQDPKGFRREG